MFGNLIKAVIDTASLPVAVVKDVVTLNKDNSTAEKAKDICADLEDIANDPLGD
jgi:hypothetical protein